MYQISSGNARGLGWEILKGKAERQENLRNL